MISVGQDFANAIQLDHLSDEQINILEKIFEDYK